MIGTLRDFCLENVCKGIKDRILTDLDQLPAIYRKRIFDHLFERGMLRDETCSRYILEQKLLAGFCDLDLFKNVYCCDYEPLLNALLSNWIGKLSNPQWSEGIIELHLRICVVSNDRLKFDRYRSNRQMVCNLIAECSNLKHLRLACDIRTCCDCCRVHPRCSEGFLESLCNSLAKIRLTSLHLESVQLVSGVRDDAYDKFERLERLHVAHAVVDHNIWCRILESSKQTLTSLKLVYFDTGHQQSFDCLILPVIMPKLRTIDVTGIVLTNRLTASLNECQSLNYVRLSLIDYGKQALKNLAGSKFVVQVHLDLGSVFSPSRDSTCNLIRSKLINFVQKTPHQLIDLSISSVSQLNPRLCHLLLNNCLFLTSLSLTNYGFMIDREKVYDQFLGIFLNDKLRAAKLYRLIVHASLSGLTLCKLFQNCGNLSDLLISSHDEKSMLNDQHLIDWGSTGVQPSQISLILPNDFTDDGLIPLLINNGSRLKSLHLHVGSHRLTIATVRTILQHCKIIESVVGIGEDLLPEETKFSHDLLTRAVAF